MYVHDIYSCVMLCTSINMYVRVYTMYVHIIDMHVLV
jgi:hypothetical protein